MSKSKKLSKYDNMSKEDVIERCEMYRRQLGGMTKSKNALNQKLKSVQKLALDIFKEYVDSHTWLEGGNPNVRSLSKFEEDNIRNFEKQLNDLGIHIVVDEWMNRN